MERIGIVRLSAIGDVIHAMPLAMGLRRAYPDAHITWIVERAAAPLLQDHPAIDGVLVHPRRGGPSVWRRFHRDLRALRLDATVDPQGNSKSGFISWWSGAPVRAGLHRRDCKELLNPLFTNRRGPRAHGPHGVDRSWAAGAALDLEPGPDDWGLRATDAECAAWRTRCEQAGADPDGPLLAVNLTDPEDARSWFTDSWRTFTREAVAAGYQVLLNGLANRADLAAKLRGEGMFDLTGKDDLRGLMAQLQSMGARDGNVLVSSDSGPVHLAVAVGLRVVCLSGSQDPKRTGPRTGAALTAWDGLSCAPCVSRICVRNPPDRACMQQIDVARVMAAVRG